MIKTRLRVVFLIVTLLAGCNIPNASVGTPESPDPAVMYTAAAQTIQAQLTQQPVTASANLSQTPIIPPTLAAIPTSTPVPVATTLPVPCNRASYNSATIDVTILDGTVMFPGQAFTKIWRLTNAGTCTWNSSYQLVFHSGDPLGVPAGYAQSLTSGNIPPGGTLDISVNLTAPITPGNYKGYWYLREPGGAYFGLGNNNSDFTIVITVNSDASITLTPVAGESGSVPAMGAVIPNIYNVGDQVTDNAVQAFLSFDISSIPAGSTIKDVKFDATGGYTVQGAPFTTLGCIYYYGHNYGVLDAGDYTLVPPIGGLIKLCNLANLNVVITGDDDWVNSVQARIGTTRFQMRVQFADLATDMNAAVDLVKFGTIKLIIAYQRP